MTSRDAFVAAAIGLTCLRCGPAPSDDGARFADEPKVDVDRTAVGAPKLLEIGEVVSSGSGCPDGTVAAVLQQEEGAHALSILFSAVTAQGRSPAFGMARGDLKACKVSVGLAPAPGYRILLANLQIRGSIDVFGGRDTPLGVNNAVRIQREFTFDVGDGSRLRLPPRESYLVNTSGSYTMEERATGLTFGRCNAAATARFGLTVQVTGANNYGDISSIDENAAPAFKVSVRPCAEAERLENPEELDVAPDDERTQIKNACVLRGVGTSRRREVCYGPSGEVLSSRLDPDVRNE